MGSMEVQKGGLMQDYVGQGWFAVKLQIRDGRTVAELTGDHFRSGQEDAANDAVSIGLKHAISEGESPVYLVRDSMVEVAVGAARRATRSGLSDCNRGIGGKPCGECERCLAAQREAFTSVILCGVDLPEDGVSARLCETVPSVLGMSFADAPWKEGMTDKEVNDILEETEEIGLVNNNRKEKDDETH